MTTEQFARERDYGAAMAIAGEMLARGLVTQGEYAIFDARFEQFYKPTIGKVLNAGSVE